MSFSGKFCFGLIGWENTVFGKLGDWKHCFREAGGWENTVIGNWGTLGAPSSGPWGLNPPLLISLGRFRVATILLSTPPPLGPSESKSLRAGGKERTTGFGWLSICHLHPPPLVYGLVGGFLGPHRPLSLSFPLIIELLGALAGLHSLFSPFPLPDFSLLEAPQQAQSEDGRVEMGGARPTS